MTSKTHLVIIPSYNTGPKLAETVGEALRYWAPVWVVIDGSTDGSEQLLAPVKAAVGDKLRIISLARNGGKGAAVIAGMRLAQEAGFQYALVMDADGQHPAQCIPEFMRDSQDDPSAMILGVPDFGPDAPASRKQGRRVGNWWTNLQTLWGGIEDSLFGFRVYPIGPSLEILDRIRGGRRYDFDTELVVRLYWRGVRPINRVVPVRYFGRGEGGISHFHYLRDNLLLIKAHTLMFFQMLPRIPKLWRMRKR